MSNEKVSPADFKKLQNEVQTLRDELAIFKRKYEDAIYNLDSDNFSGGYTAEQNNMKSQISVTAGAIKSMVTKTDLATSLEKYSMIEQTADAIRSTVSAGASLKDAVLISDLSQATDESKIYKIREVNDDGKVIGETYFYFNTMSNTWEKISGDSIYTVFAQTNEGFVLQGNTIIDGNTTITRNLTLSGNVTWDLSNSPVQARYAETASENEDDWHTTQTGDDKFMKMSFDGGKSWSIPTQIIGEKGDPGTSGDEASVTAEAVFNALTDFGADQGIYGAYYDGKNRVFINAEYINSGTLSADRIDVDSLRVQKLYSHGDGTGYYVKTLSDYGDLGIYSQYAEENALPSEDSCVWGVMHSDPIQGAVNFYAHGNNYLGYNRGHGVTYPKGAWDFANCTISGTDTIITQVAVFGE